MAKPGSIQEQAETGLADRLDALQSSLVELAAQRADRYDPVRFAYIQSLVEHSQGQREPVQLHLLGQAEEALADYLKDRTRTKQQAEQSLAAHPQARPTLKTLFDNGDFKAVQRSAERLTSAGQKPSQALDALRKLTKDLLTQEITANRQAHGPAFDEFLQQQEKRVLAALTGRPDTTSEHTQSDKVLLPELRAIKSLRQTQAQQHAPLLVSQAISSAPADPGPLNPQMLAIRAMTHMRELSPHYLNRFVSFLDTLLWLEQHADRPDSETSKRKGQPGRSKKGKSRT